MKGQGLAPAETREGFQIKHFVVMR
jgi:hypothetical protein